MLPSRDPSDKDAPKEFTTTKSGLKYRVLRKSDGAKPKASATNVTVHYKGWLDNGKEFDSSYKRDETDLRFRSTALSRAGPKACNWSAKGA